MQKQHGDRFQEATLLYTESGAGGGSLNIECVAGVRSSTRAESNGGGGGGWDRDAR